MSQTRCCWIHDDLFRLVELKLVQFTQIPGVVLKDLVAFVLQLVIRLAQQCWEDEELIFLHTSITSILI